MEQRFIVILNFNPQSGEILKIRLTDAELAESEKYEDMESYLSTLEKSIVLICLTLFGWLQTSFPNVKLVFNYAKLVRYNL